jgi:hypothetical protein
VASLSPLEMKARCNLSKRGVAVLKADVAKAIAVMFVSLATFTVALILSSCADSHESDETGTCYSAFQTVLEEWEAHAAEPVPEHCQHLDDDYEVRVVQSDRFPWGSCDPLAVGCTVPGHMAIYIEEGRTRRERVHTAVHEWIHALSECALGDLDAMHRRAGLWEGSLPSPVETRALANVEIGECL